MLKTEDFIELEHGQSATPSTSVGDRSELFEIAQERFIQNDYKTAEVLLQQILLSDKKRPEVFHMLGTIFYDQGKFNKAIKSFERALELDPTFTDASVGLSIILNDLGRYQEGQAVFEKAQNLLDSKSNETDPYILEKIATKHEELGQLYQQCSRHKEALEQFLKALQLSSRTVEITMKIVDCFEALDSPRKALKQLRYLVREYPQYTQARIRMGKVFYNMGKIVDALESWEAVLLRDPENQECLRYIRMANEAGVTHAPNL